MPAVVIAFSCRGMNLGFLQPNSHVRPPRRHTPCFMRGDVRQGHRRKGGFSVGPRIAELEGVEIMQRLFRSVVLAGLMAVGGLTSLSTTTVNAQGFGSYSSGYGGGYPGGGYSGGYGGGGGSNYYSGGSYCGGYSIPQYGYGGYQGNQGYGGFGGGYGRSYGGGYPGSSYSHHQHRHHHGCGHGY